MASTRLGLELLAVNVMSSCCRSKASSATCDGEPPNRSTSAMGSSQGVSEEMVSVYEMTISSSSSRT